MVLALYFSTSERVSDVKALLQSGAVRRSNAKYVRAALYDYEFTDFAELTKSGAWWRRRYIGLFFPEASLREPASTRPQN